MKNPFKQDKTNRPKPAQFCVLVNLQKIPFEEEDRVEWTGPVYISAYPGDLSANIPRQTLAQVTDYKDALFIAEALNSTYDEKTDEWDPLVCNGLANRIWHDKMISYDHDKGTWCIVPIPEDVASSLKGKTNMTPARKEFIVYRSYTNGLRVTSSMLTEEHDCETVLYKSAGEERACSFVNAYITYFGEDYRGEFIQGTYITNPENGDTWIAALEGDEVVWLFIESKEFNQLQYLKSFSMEDFNDGIFKIRSMTPSKLDKDILTLLLAYAQKNEEDFLDFVKSDLDEQLKVDEVADLITDILKRNNVTLEALGVPGTELVVRSRLSKKVSAFIG